MDSLLERLGLPPVELVQPPVHGGLLLGRCPSDGYQRGWGLEYGELGAQLEQHPLYQEALAAAVGRTVMTVDRLKNLFLLITTRLDRLGSQNIIEFGSYKGGSLLFFGVLLKRLFPEAKVYGLDTYAGMPPTDQSVDLHQAGDFSNTSLEDIREAADALGLDNIVLVKGLVEDTFTTQVPARETFGLAHIDLDIYQPIRYIQDAVWDRMTPGGYVAYDDATVSSCIGATQAVEELIIARRVHSEQIYPHFVFRAGLDRAAAAPA